MSVFKTPKHDVDAAYRNFADVMYRIAMAQLHCDADAQDAVQEAFLRYLTKAPPFFSPEHEKAWLIRVTVNCCYDIARSKTRHPTVPLEEAFDLAAPDDSAYRQLLDTVAQIPEIYRSVVILHSLEGFSLKETAEILKLSLSAAKMRWSRACEMLRQIIQEG